MVLTSTNPLHPVYELLARGIYGYFSGDAATKLLVTTQLSSLGYSIDKVFDDPVTSFQALGLVSKDGSRPPVLVSQGTVDEKDSIDDANPKGVGFNGFSANKDMVKAWIVGIISDKTKNPAGIEVDLTGQSLGGALAQWFASEYPDLIREAVTFQSPGISKAASDTFISKGGKSSQITHYIVNGDLVSLGGEAFLPGTLRVGDYQTPAIDPEKFGDKHTAGILNANLPGASAAVTNELTVTLDDLNKHTFTFTGQDWQDFVDNLKQTNPTLATAAINRSTVEALRIGSGSSAILLGQVTPAVLTPNPGSTNNDGLVLNVTKLTNPPTPPIGSPAQNIAEGRIIDLSSYGGQTLKADITTESSAAYNNNVGFYTVENTAGTIRLTDGTLLPPGDPRYVVEAIKQAIANTFLTANKTDSKTDQIITGGAIYAPVVVAQGTLNDFVTANPTNAGTETAIHAYFNYLGANPDKFDHFRALGNNTFGVEDLYAGGDRDFNDVVINMNVRV